MVPLKKGCCGNPFFICCHRNSCGGYAEKAAEIGFLYSPLFVVFILNCLKNNIL